MVPSFNTFNNLSGTSAFPVKQIWGSSTAHQFIIQDIEPKEIKPEEHKSNKKEEKISNKFFSNVVDLIGEKDERTNKTNIKRKSK